MPDGVPGVRVTVRTMRALVNLWRVDPRIISAARSIVFLTPAKDAYSEAQALFWYVRDHVRYVMDVNGVETLSTPLMTLETRSGDCDDQSALLATLFEAIGYPTRFVVAGYNEYGVFEHVYLQVLLNDQWITCDPTENEGFGWEPPDAVTMMIEGA